MRLTIFCQKRNEGIHFICYCGPKGNVPSHKLNVIANFRRKCGNLIFLFILFDLGSRSIIHLLMRSLSVNKIILNLWFHLPTSYLEIPSMEGLRFHHLFFWDSGLERKKTISRDDMNLTYKTIYSCRASQAPRVLLSREMFPPCPLLLHLCYRYRRICSARDNSQKPLSLND